MDSYGHACHHSASICEHGTNTHIEKKKPIQKVTTFRINEKLFSAVKVALYQPPKIPEHVLRKQLELPSGKLQEHL